MSAPMIRPADGNDVPELERLMAALNAHLGMPAVEGPTQLAAALSGPAALLFGYLAVDGKSAVGYALGQPFFDTDTGQMGTWLLDLYVEPEQRGRGLGKALMAKVAARARSLGHPMVALAVYDDNPARNLYLKLGAGLDKPAQVLELRGEALDRLARATHF